MTDYGYTRSSTLAQDGEGGLHLLSAAGIPPERTYFDRGISGMRASRPRFDALCKVLVAGDTVTTPNLSRIGRNTKNVLDVIEQWDALGVGLIVLDLGGSVCDTRTPVGRFLLTIIAAVNRLTRDFISEATTAKLAALKADGKRLGGVPKLTEAQRSRIPEMRAKGMDVPAIAAALGVGKSTVYRELEKARETT